MAHSSMLHVPVDDELKAQATQALEAMGLSVSDAVRILLKRVVDDEAFPLELKLPNAQTRQAMEEARAAPRACDYTKSFLKDWERLSRPGRYDLRRLTGPSAMPIPVGTHASS